MVLTSGDGGGRRGVVVSFIGSSGPSPHRLLFLLCSHADTIHLFATST